MSEVTNQPTMSETTTSKAPGRPVNPNSKRQLELAAKAERGEGRRGRPVNPESNRQKYLATKGENPNGQGRPVNPLSARQQRMADIEARKRNGTYKLGRPKMIKEEVVVVEEVIETTVELSEVVSTPKVKKTGKKVVE